MAGRQSNGESPGDAREQHYGTRRAGPTVAIAGRGLDHGGPGCADVAGHAANHFRTIYFRDWFERSHSAAVRHPGAASKGAHLLSGGTIFWAGRPDAAIAIDAR